MHKIDYAEILRKSKFMVEPQGKKLSVIIPAYGRESFLEPLILSFRKAEEKSNIPISFTVVEHSEVPLHVRNSQRLNINHIWIPKNSDEPFNKCLCMNIGACVVKGDEYIFHDIDCLVQSTFLIDLYTNIESKNSQAIQTFSDRRVLYLDEILTYRALILDLDVDSLKEGNIDPKSEDYNGVTPPGIYGAPGGSIWIKKDIFLEVGGYDPNIFFGYSPEDIFFWDKVSTVTTMDTCTDPRVEIFHMKHPPTHASNPFLRQLQQLHLAYRDGCDDKEKKEFLDLQKNFLMEAYG